MSNEELKNNPLFSEVEIQQFIESYAIENQLKQKKDTEIINNINWEETLRRL